MKKVAIITGGAQGIGSELVKTFLRTDYFVACIDHDLDALDSFFAENQLGNAIPVHCDISDERELEKAIDKIVKASGRIDCLINNAMTNITAPLSEISRRDWDRVIAVNLTAPLFAAKFCEKNLRESKGSIVNITSTRALMSEPHTEAYSASKGGLLSLTHSLAISLAPDVRVNSVSPGWIEVSHLKKPSARKVAVLSEADHLQHPAGRVGKAEDIAEMVLYLCSEKAGFITGQNFIVDGGMTKKMIYC